jgi:hypothetical protein
MYPYFKKEKYHAYEKSFLPADGSDGDPFHGRLRR